MEPEYIGKGRKYLWFRIFSVWESCHHKKSHMYDSIVWLNGVCEAVEAMGDLEFSEDLRFIRGTLCTKYGLMYGDK